MSPPVHRDRRRYARARPLPDRVRDPGLTGYGRHVDYRAISSAGASPPSGPAGELALRNSGRCATPPAGAGVSMGTGLWLNRFGCSLISDVLQILTIDGPSGQRIGRIARAHSALCDYRQHLQYTPDNRPRARRAGPVTRVAARNRFGGHTFRDHGGQPRPCRSSYCSRSAAARCRSATSASSGSSPCLSRRCRRYTYISAMVK